MATGKTYVGGLHGGGKAQAAAATATHSASAPAGKYKGGLHSAEIAEGSVADKIGTWFTRHILRKDVSEAAKDAKRAAKVVEEVTEKSKGFMGFVSKYKWWGVGAAAVVGAGYMLTKGNEQQPTADNFAYAAPAPSAPMDASPQISTGAANAELQGTLNQHQLQRG